jgi:DNA-binding LacI/PurR family transcriptional regulator
MATVRDVPHRPRVSIETASRVLDGEGCVALGTAVGARRAIDSLGYLPNVAARRHGDEVLMHPCDLHADEERRPPLRSFHPGSVDRFILTRPCARFAAVVEALEQRGAPHARIAPTDRNGLLDRSESAVLPGPPDGSVSRALQGTRDTQLIVRASSGPACS